MTAECFWQIVQRSFDRCGGIIEEQDYALADELEPLTTDEIVSFDRHFFHFYQSAYTWGLWGAAFVINGGCSDDGFKDFRS